MTKEEFEKAKEISAKIEDVKSYIKSLENHAKETLFLGSTEIFEVIPIPESIANTVYKQISEVYKQELQTLKNQFSELVQEQGEKNEHTANIN